MAKPVPVPPVEAIEGDDGHNVLYDEQGFSPISALGGNDRVVANNYTFAQNHHLFDQSEGFGGGSGSDTIDYHLVSKAQGHNSVYVDVDLNAGIASRVVDGVASNFDTLVSFENVIGSAYDDDITGDNGNNNLQGGSGDDTLDGLGGNDYLYGQNGEDWLFGRSGNDHLFGGNDADHLYGEGNNDHLYGQAGDDWLFGGFGNDVLEGGTGEDHIYGNSGNDTINGGHGDDVIYGHTGNDRINGGRGNDTIDAGAGSDTLVHAGGVSISVDLWSGTSETVFGTDSIVNFEHVQSGSGSDNLFGDSQNNNLDAGAGNDTVIGGLGNDYIYGGSGEDWLLGSQGNDWIFGNNDDDELQGQTGSDNLYGGSGDDKIRGGADNDVIRGDAGDDLIFGGEGADNIKGGAGADVFRWEAGDIGTDVFTDFVYGVDKLSFEDSFFAFLPGVGSNYAGLLMAVAAPGFQNASNLLANTGEAGWTNIGFFSNVHANTLNSGIATGNLFAVEVNEVFIPDNGGFVLV